MQSILQGLDTIYPIGSIYFSTIDTDPGTYFGGTWEQLTDKILIGAGNTYSGGDTGGSTTHTLTTTEMPSHNHSFTGSAVTSGGISANHTHTGTSGNPSANHQHTGPSHTHSGPNHYHSYAPQYYLGNGGAAYDGQSLSGNNGGRTLGGWNGIPSGNTGWAGTGATGAAGTGWSGTVSAWHTHTTTTGTVSAGHTHSVTASGTIGNNGSGSAFSIMPPYLAVYMWKRTA